MTKVVGIPRSLFYYKYFPLWKTFFEETGTEIAVSPETCRSIMESGISSCVGEACLPVKAWFGHAQELAGRCDAIFAPRYTSVARYEYICPKFGGLPDMARHGMKGLPELIAPEVNRHDRADGGLRAALETAKALGVGRKRAKLAYDRAVQEYLKHRAGQVGRPLNAVAALRAADGAAKEGGGRALRILLLGHAYTVGDRYVNMDVVRKLSNMGVEAVPLEYVDARELRRAAERLEKPMFWTFGAEALGMAHVLIDTPSLVDGVLHLTCFGCGVDSFAGFMFERRVRGRGIPFATVSLDEHTGEAGLETRLEAFADTLRYRRAGA